MPYILQSKLLRVIQERQVQRLGSSKLRDLNIRIIAATNCDLKRSIAERSFREDLYFRLSAFKISIPPLRERPMDIMPLVHQFIDRNNSDRISKQVSLNAQRKLVNYHWPGNVRELENVVSRAIILAHQTDIDEEHISFDELQEQDFISTNFFETVAGGALAKQITASPTAAAEAHNLDKAVKNSECQAIIAAINSTPSRKEAAKRLGISPRTLRHKIQKLREDGFNLTHAYVI
jgi:two-component system response regulator FlrC